MNIIDYAYLLGAFLDVSAFLSSMSTTKEKNLYNASVSLYVMQTGRAIGQGQSMTAKNLPAEIIKLTEFFSVGFELHPDKHFNLLPVSFFFFWKTLI